MIDCVYPLGTGSKWSNNELRFSLRSLEKYALDLWKVFVVGADPGFLSDQVNHIPTVHNFANPATNIAANIYAACQDSRLSERFCMMNDDYFLCDYVTLDSYPYFHRGEIRDTLRRCAADYYPHLFATQEELKRRKLPTFDFDVHYPIVLEKSKVLELAGWFNWDRSHGYTFKSTYCNFFGVEGILRPDCKVNQQKDLYGWQAYAQGRECFSIGDMALGKGLAEFLWQRFPEPCIFELS